MNVCTCIDELIIYAQNNLYLDELDTEYARNGIMSAIGLDSYKQGLADEKKISKLTTPEKLLKNLADACVAEKLITEDKTEELKASVMKKLYAKPSKINDMFLFAGGSGNKKAQAFLMEYVKASGFGSYKDNCFIEGLTDNGIEVLSIESEGYGEEMLFSRAVDRLISYAKTNLLLDEFDQGYARRAVFDIFGAKNYVLEHDVLAEDEEEEIEADRPDELLSGLFAAAEGAGYRVKDIELAKSAVMGALSLLPSEIEDLCAGFSDKKKMEFLYDYCGKNYFVKKSDIERNIRFKTGYTYRDIEVIVNKNNAEMYPSAGVKGYPACALCRESVGYAPLGYENKRTFAMTLGGEEYDWSFLPFGYVPRLGIAAAQEHGKKIGTEHMVNALADFVDMYPSFFAGMDAQLSGIGSYSYNHGHIVAGDELMPISRVKPLKRLECTKYPLAEISVLDWCTTALRISSQSRKVICDIVDEVRVAWENYSDEKKGIIAKDNSGKHNGICVAMRKYYGKYTVDIVLRSNIISKKYPNGVFNTHPEHSVIKAEDNCLLDALGLFFLPSRTEMEIKTLKECLANREELPEEMNSFKKMYDSIIAEYGVQMTKVEAGIYIKGAFCTMCQSILEDLAVFTKPEDFVKFLTGLGNLIVID